MDELKMLENDFMTLFEGYPPEFSAETRRRMMKSTVENLFNYLRRKLEKKSIFEIIIERLTKN